MSDPQNPPLTMSEVDELLLERDELRTELARLRPIAEAATYLHGPEACIPGDGDCDEYWDPGTGGPTDVQECSHVEQRFATFADVYARERLEELVRALLAQLNRPAGSRLNGLDTVEGVRDALAADVLSVAWHAQDELPLEAARALNARQPYLAVVTAHLDETRQGAG